MEKFKAISSDMKRFPLSFKSTMEIEKILFAQDVTVNGNLRENKEE